MFNGGFMELYIGTSGWSYSWNPNGFKWYVRNSRLNAVELNASFYRIPYKTIVVSWSRLGKELRWSIKVYRAVTHWYKLKAPRSLEIFNYFRRVFEPLESIGVIDFYLFQLPPSFHASIKNWSRIEEIASKTELGERMAIEWRHRSWFSHEWLDRAKSLGVTIVSVDSPEIIYYTRTSESVYVRLHGRSYWYSHYYTDEELLDVIRNVLRLKPKKIYVFFNNDHAMLENARRMMELFRKCLEDNACL